MPANDISKLPNLCQFASGAEVQSTQDWINRRQEIRAAVLNIEYGGLPPTPASTQVEELHTQTIGRLHDARFMTCRISTGPELRFSFILTLLIPPGDGPFPVVLTGDACWRYVTDSIAEDVIGRGFILAQFNRVELAPDANRSDRTSGLYSVYPKGSYGALAAWAWGYHRCVDALLQIEQADAARIAVVGHSRGGKASLLAGATDERIALTSANNSGAGGAGCFRLQGPGSETLQDLIRVFPYWYGPDLHKFIGREQDLPFDQHFLKALIAPRALLTTEALDDHWANPSGSWQTHLAAHQVFNFLSAPDRAAISFRQGPHRHSAEDWTTFLNFMAWQLCEGPRPTGLNENPFTDLTTLP